MKVPPNPIYAVIPAEAGIHFALEFAKRIKMDSRFRGNDELRGKGS